VCRVGGRPKPEEGKEKGLTIVIRSYDVLILMIDLDLSKVHVGTINMPSSLRRRRKYIYASRRSSTRQQRLTRVMEVLSSHPC
jgi:hypothetical protein